MSGCMTYCTHGGICELESGHDGLHDSSYCQWPDTQSATRRDADEILSAKPGGNAIVIMQALIDGGGDDD